MPRSHSDLGPSRAQRAVICLAIAANALSAGGIFMFPLLSPALATLLKLTQPQLTTIVLAGMIGQYPFAAFVGKVIDKYGPAFCSLIAAVLFASSFHFFAVEVTNCSSVPTPQTLASFRNLSVLFLFSGLGTVCSYFSSVFASTKTLPAYPGIASGTSMALFGLSPLLLSTIATSKFVDEETGLLKIASFMDFLAVFTACIHIFGFFALRLVPIHPTLVLADLQEDEEPNEQSNLIPRKANPDTERGRPAFELFQDTNFWLLACYCLLIFGACEMVISNIGTIVLSLDPVPSLLLGGRAISDQVIAKQIKVLSLSNTISRIVVGPLADFLCPIAVASPSGAETRRRFGRTAFLSVAALLAAFTFLWMQFGARHQGDAWALSLGIGVGYGTLFTVLPGIVSAVWGEVDLGRNFGIVTYAPFIGTPLFSYLYAFTSASHAQDGLCRGTGCWRLTFWISCVTSLLAFCVSCILYRRWKGLL